MTLGMILEGETNLLEAQFLSMDGKTHLQEFKSILTFTYRGYSPDEEDSEDRRVLKDSVSVCGSAECDDHEAEFDEAFNATLFLQKKADDTVVDWDMFLKVKVDTESDDIITASGSVKDGGELVVSGEMTADMDFDEYSYKYSNLQSLSGDMAIGKYRLIFV